MLSVVLLSGEWSAACGVGNWRAACGYFLIVTNPNASSSQDSVPERTARPWWFRARMVVAIWTLPGLLSCLQEWSTGYLDHEPARLLPILLAQMPAWYLWAALTPVIFALADRTPIRRPVKLAAVISHVALWLCCLMLHGVVIVVVAYSIVHGSRPSPWVMTFARDVGRSSDHALDGNAARRPFPGTRGTGAPGGGYPSVFS